MFTITGTPCIDRFWREIEGDDVDDDESKEHDVFSDMSDED